MERIYSEKFKLQCVNLILIERFSIGEVANKFSIGKRKIYVWLNDYKKGNLFKDNVVEECNKEQNETVRREYISETLLPKNKIAMDQQYRIERLQSKVRTLEEIVKLHEAKNQKYTLNGS
jgi:transposase-like protein